MSIRSRISFLIGSLLVLCLLAAGMSTAAAFSDKTAFTLPTATANIAAVAAGNTLHNFLPMIANHDLTNGSAKKRRTPTPTSVFTQPTATKPAATATPFQPASTTTPIQPTATKPAPTATPIQPTATIKPSPTPTTSTVGHMYYVSTSGSDTNPGTSASPWRTIQYAVNKLAAGDTLNIKSGTYLQTSTIAINNSGTASSPITIQTEPGAATLAVISGDVNGDRVDEATDTPGQNPNNHYHLIQILGSYVHFQNLEVAFSGAHGITSYGSHNVISGNKVHDIWGSGIWMPGANPTIENNTVWRAAESNYCGGASGARQCNGNWESGIAWGDTSGQGNKAPNATVRGNIVFHTSGEGIICMEAEGGVIENNVAYDNWALNLDLDQCSNYTIQRNLLYYTSDTSWWKGGTYPADSLMLSNEANNPNYTTVGHDRVVINNILVGGRFRFWAGERPSALVNDLFANNTIVNTQGGQTAMLIDKPITDPTGTYTHHINTRVANNLVYQTNATTAELLANVADTTGLTFDHNSWSRTPPTNLAGTGDVVGNPLLVNPNQTYGAGGVDPKWYQLTSGSPARDKGTSGLSKDDYFGTVRPQGTGVDIGAHEYITVSSAP